MNSSITKAELVAICAENTGNSRAITENVVNAFLDTIQEKLKEGSTITLVNFGSFSVTERQERPGRNPKTGEPLTIPASKAAKFKAGKGLKDSLN